MPKRGKVVACKNRAEATAGKKMTKATKQERRPAMPARTLVAAIMLLTVIGHFAHAQEYPVKAVRIIIPFAPGGPNDLAARPVAQKLYEFLGQPFVIDYRAGANGIIGCDLVAKSAPDGYTMAVISSSFSINSSSYAKLPFDPLRDFT